MTGCNLAASIGSCEETEMSRSGDDSKGASSVKLLICGEQDCLTGCLRRVRFLDQHNRNTDKDDGPYQGRHCRGKQAFTGPGLTPQADAGSDTELLSKHAFESFPASVNPASGGLGLTFAIFRGSLRIPYRSSLQFLYPLTGIAKIRVCKNA